MNDWHARQFVQYMSLLVSRITTHVAVGNSGIEEYKRSETIVVMRMVEVVASGKWRRSEYTAMKRGQS